MVAMAPAVASEGMAASGDRIPERVDPTSGTGRLGMGPIAPEATCVTEPQGESIVTGIPHASAVACQSGSSRSESTRNLDWLLDTKRWLNISEVE